MTEKEIWDKAYKRVFELYGDAPDLRIVSRFYSEKQAFIIFEKQAYHSFERTEIGFAANTAHRRFFPAHGCRFRHSARLLRFRCFYSENNKLLCKFRSFR